MAYDWYKTTRDLGYEYLIHMIIDIYYKHENLNDAGSFIKVSGMTLRNKMDQLGLPRRSKGGCKNKGYRKKDSQRNLIIENKDMIKELTPDQFCKRFNVSRSTFYKTVKDHKLKYSKEDIKYDSSACSFRMD